MKTRIALSLFFALLTVCSASAGQQCDGCVTYKRTVARSKIPFDGPRVCLDFIQMQRDKVVVRFVKDGRDVHTVSNETGPKDRFCFGKWRFTRESVKPDEIWFCNGTKSARLSDSDIAQLVLRNGTSKGEYVCLLGSSACDGKAITAK